MELDPNAAQAIPLILLAIFVLFLWAMAEVFGDLK